MFDTSVQVDLKRALAGGGLAAAITLLGMWLSGLASGSDLAVLLRDFIPSAQSFSETITLASATILALMLTLLGMSSSSDSHLKAAHYARIRQIAFGDALVFVAAVTVSLLLNVPLTESSKLSPTLESVTYYGALGLTALLGGALISIVLMIYNAISDMVEVIALGKEEHPLYDTEAESGEAQHAQTDEREQADER